jgi:hypothetical protein
MSSRKPVLIPLLCAALAVSAVSPVLAQVEVSTLPAPDIFTTGLADTGLPRDLWKGTSPELARQALNLIARKPLSPAAQSLAYRLLATGAPAPDGAGNDLDLAAARAEVLLSLGDAAGVRRLMERTPNLQSNARLSHAAAEASLLTGDEDRACRVGDALTQGREDVYWLRLKSYCQLKAGDEDGAQLTFNLAQTTAKDPIFGRLMGAKLAGAGDPGKPSVRNGLEYALSFSLGLAPPAPPALSVTTAPPPPYDAAAHLTADLILAAVSGPPEARKAAQGTIVLLAALGAPLDNDRRAEMAGYGLESRAAPGRLLALDLAADRGLKAETALVALMICAEAGPKGLPAADRARLVRALIRVGMAGDALRLALEGLPPA